MPASRHRPAVRLAGASTAAVSLVLVGCYATANAPMSAAAPTPAQACERSADATLVAVARRIYAQAADGRAVAAVTRRLTHAPALASAVAAHDPAATTAALQPLLKHQVRRLEITAGPEVLARVGTTNALAPVTGAIRDAFGSVVGQYRFAVASDRSIAGLVHALTGAGVAVDAGSHRIDQLAGPANAAATGTVAGAAFPRGPLSIRLTLPRTATTQCGATPADTAAKTIGAVGQRLLRSEQSSPATARVLHHVATDPQFLRAVATDDPVLLRARIVHFFRDRSLHVVRIRATTSAGRLVNDVGGPYVLAPAPTPLRLHGRTIGTVTLSIQDDTGYIKLMHRFTGALVSLSTPTGTVPGSQAPTPGRSYRSFTFPAQTFPTGPLKVTLLS